MTNRIITKISCQWKTTIMLFCTFCLSYSTYNELWELVNGGNKKLYSVYNYKKKPS